MGITANTEKRTKTQGPNINSNRQWESQQIQRNEPKKQGPNINPYRQWESQQTQRNEPKHKAPT